jgi:hypothetical protein
MDASNKADPTKDTVTSDGVYTRYTVGITAAYLFIVAIAFFGGHIGASSKMTPNEWGDLAAGIFAPLAWLWLAVGYYLQRLELIEQRHEIRAARVAAEAQAAEQKHQALATSNLVAVTTAQLDLARQNLAIQKQHLRIGASPRFQFKCLEVGAGRISLRLLNVGTVATEVRVFPQGGWTVDYCNSPNRN